MDKDKISKVIILGIFVVVIMVGLFVNYKEYRENEIIPDYTPIITKWRA